MIKQTFLIMCLALAGGCSAPEPSSPPEAKPPGTAPAEPGRVVLRRLSRFEYNNTVRDLFDTALRPADDFPADEVAFGFDNNGDALMLSPVLLEQYQRAAELLVEEALDAQNPRRSQLLWCTPADRAGYASCAEQVLQALGRRVWRRPLTEAERGALLALAESAWQEGGSFEEGMQLTLEELLLSPNFLYRPEPLEHPDSAEVQPLDDFQIATRLSYFLWSTTPDELLLELAAQGRLRDEAVLREQTQRMLLSPKAAGFIDSFFGQWLPLRELAQHPVSESVYRTYSGTLRDSMGEETRRFAAELLQPDGAPLGALLTADFSFVNARLARHYGLATVPAGDGFVRVSLADTPRRGLLGQGAFLTATSYPGRTSPVRRGRWILDQLLCAPPPPPPPNVPAFPETGADENLRKQLELHRQSPACNGCHKLMDPIGLGLEGFDGIGSARREYRPMGPPIDDSGTLDDGRSFQGAAELGRLLAADPRFTRCAVEKLFTFALGRGVTADDQARIDGLVAGLAQRGGHLRGLIELIVSGDAFRSHRGEAPGGAP